MQSIEQLPKSTPPSTLVIRVPNQQYNPKIVRGMVPGATKVVFGIVPDKKGNRCFSAIFHFGTPTPPKVDKPALAVQIETSGQKPSVCCGSDCCVAGGRGAGAGAAVVHTPTASVPAPIDYDITIERPAVDHMFNSALAGKLVRDACNASGYKGSLKLAILKSPVTQLLTARITTSGTIPLTEDEVRALIYRTECVYTRM